jgi:hypothetical protein
LINDKSSKIESQIAEAAKQVDSSNAIPSGYLEIKLSSAGKYGAPEVFHVRNFSTEDLVHLAVSDDSELPQRTVEFLNNVIWENKDGVDVANWHEKEVIETLLIIFKTYYGKKLTNLTWDATDEDKEYLAHQFGGKDSQEYQNRLNALETGEWKPVFDLNLDDVKFYKLPDDYKTQANIKNKFGFKCTYSWPRYGDVLKIKAYTDALYKEKDKRYERLQKIARFRQQAEQKVLSGSTVNLMSVPDITNSDREELRKYEEEKLNFMTVCMRAIQLTSIGDIDLKDAPLEERVKYAQDPGLDFATFKQIQTAFNENLKIGPIEDMNVLDPILNKIVNRKISFRVFDIISALRDATADGVTVDFE